MAVLLAASAGPQPAAAASAPPLVGQWRFDEGAGQSARDDGPHGLDGRLGLTGSAESSDPVRIGGLSGGALRFDGKSFVRLPQSGALDMRTLSAEAVVRAPSSPGSWRYVVSRGASGCFAGSYGLYSAKAGGIALYVYDGTDYYVSATARPADVWNGAWHHVAGTFDGAGLRLYLDGRPVGAPVAVPRPIDYASTSTSTYFGRYAGDCNLSLVGDVDMIRLSAGALDAQAVADAARRALEHVMTPPSGPPPPAGRPPVAKPPLPAAAPGGVLRAPPNAANGGKRPAEPGAPPRACRVRLSPRSISVGRRSVVVVRASFRGAALAMVPVTVRRVGSRKIIARSRTGADGRARIRVRLRRPGLLRVSVRNVPHCAPAHVRVRRAG